MLLRTDWTNWITIRVNDLDENRLIAIIELNKCTRTIVVGIFAITYFYNYAVAITSMCSYDEKIS